MLDSIANMFHKLYKIVTMKKYSYSFEEVTNGTNSMKNLDLSLTKVISKLRKRVNVDTDELNYILEKKFSIDGIVPGSYKLNESFIPGMCFEIDSVHATFTSYTNLDNLFIILKEHTYGAELSLTISAKDFHEFMSLIPPINLKKDE